MTSLPFATAVNHAPAVVAPGPLRRAATMTGDLLAGAGVVFAFPVAILVIGTPIVLAVRFVLWMVGAL